MIPNIKVGKAWTAQTVRDTCIKFNLYTCGDNADYGKMLNMVADSKPTVENIYTVANDIAAHSDGRDVEDVMFFIGNNAIITTYAIEE